jgi:preprotein translocase subunit SecA
VIYPITQDSASLAEESNYSQQYIEDAILQDIRQAYAKREQELGKEAARAVERRIVLSVLDRKWRDHLYEMQYLQEGIGLRAFAQKDPLVEYQREGYELFVAMMESLKEEVVVFLFNVQVTISQIDEDPSIDDDEVIVPGAAPTQLRNVTYSAPSESGGTASKPAAKPASAGDEVGRNAPCPCGSGKKYKRCHGDPRNGA